MFSGQTLYTIYNTTYLLTNHQILHFLDVNTINYTKKVAIICEISGIKFLTKRSIYNNGSCKRATLTRRDNYAKQ